MSLVTFGESTWYINALLLCVCYHDNQRFPICSNNRMNGQATSTEQQERTESRGSSKTCRPTERQSSNNELRHQTHQKTTLAFADLDASSGVNLVDGVSRRTAGLAVQIETLHKHAVVADAAYPDVPLPQIVQLHPLADVQPGRDTHHHHPTCVRRTVDTLRTSRHLTTS